MKVLDESVLTGVCLSAAFPSSQFAPENGWRIASDAADTYDSFRNENGLRYIIRSPLRRLAPGVKLPSAGKLMTQYISFALYCILCYTLYVYIVCIFRNMLLSVLGNLITCLITEH